MNNSPNISFTSKINFVSVDDFEKLFEKRITPELFVGHPWSMNETKISDTFLATKDISVCTSGSIATKDNTIMLHLLPTFGKNLVDMNEFIKNSIDTLSETDIKSLLLIGAKSSSSNSFGFSTMNYVYLESQNFFSVLKNAVKRFNPTIFEKHMKSRCETNYIYDFKNDTYYINTMLDKFDRTSSLKNMNDVHRAFDSVKISPRDEVGFSL